MTTITHAISAALFHFVWQGLAVGLLLWILLGMMRNSPARQRYAVSCAALALMSALPLVTVWVTLGAPVTPGAPVGSLVAGSYSGPPEVAPAAPWVGVLIAALERWALPVWFFGVLIFAGRFLWSAKHISRLRRDGVAAEGWLIDTASRVAHRMNVVRPARVLISRLAYSPSVVGWLRPAVLLPAATVLNLSAEQLEAILAHEFAHIRRHDYLINMLQTLAETLFFYQPAVWWVSSRIRVERELCCDDLAVEFCGDAIGYARALTKLERLRLTSPDLVVSSAAGPLLYRIRRLAGVAQEQPPSKLPAVFAVGLALICFMANLRAAHAQLQPDAEARVSRDAIWVDTVKYGDLQIAVRALGAVTTPNTAELKVAAPQASFLQIGQSASIALRRSIVMAGKVARIEPSVINGTRTVVVALQAPAPEFTGQPVDGTIGVRTLNNVVYVGRPGHSGSATTTELFKLEPDGNHATRVKVRFGAPSVTTVQILEGLKPGDRVILSDMAQYAGYDHLRLE